MGPSAGGTPPRTGPDGFAEFVSARYPVLVRYGALLMADHGRGEDLAQEALVKTYRAWRKLHPDGDPEGYTRRVMAHAAWRAGRRMWRREVPSAVLPEPLGSDPYDSRDTVSDRAGKGVVCHPASIGYESSCVDCCVEMP